MVVKVFTRGISSNSIGNTSSEKKNNSFFAKMNNSWFSIRVLFRDFMKAYRMRLVMEGHATTLRAYLKDLKERKEAVLDPRSVLNKKFKIRNEIKKAKKARKEVKVQIRALIDVMHKLIKSMIMLGNQQLTSEHILEQSTEAEREVLSNEFPQLFSGPSFSDNGTILVEAREATVSKLNTRKNRWRQIGTGTVQIKKYLAHGNRNKPTTWSMVFIFADKDQNERRCELQITKFLQLFRLRSENQTFLKGFAPDMADMGANGLETMVGNYYRCEFGTHEHCEVFATTLSHLISDLRLKKMNQEVNDSSS